MEKDLRDRLRIAPARLDELNALLGNYQISLSDTELATFNRTLYGGKVSYQSVSRTKYGDPDTKVIVYGAEIKQAHINDELKATGGSLQRIDATSLSSPARQHRNACLSWRSPSGETW